MVKIKSNTLVYGPTDKIISIKTYNAGQTVLHSYSEKSKSKSSSFKIEVVRSDKGWFSTHITRSRLGWRNTLFVLLIYAVLLYWLLIHLQICNLLMATRNQTCQKVGKKVYLCSGNDYASDIDPILLSEKCYNMIDQDRFECLSEDGSTPDCKSKSCCWSTPKNASMPCCYKAVVYRTYKFLNVSASDMGAVAYLELIFNSSYPQNIPLIRIDFNYRTPYILEVKIYDPTRARFEPPLPQLPHMSASAAKDTKYFVSIDMDRLGFKIVRLCNNKPVFDTQDVGEFIFSDQLLQLYARLPSNNIYGLGQQRNDFWLDMDWNKFTLFNHNQSPKDKGNLYGTHPFYLAMEDDGFSSGVLLFNSNAMEIELSPIPTISYRTIGGVLDFFIFLGPTPADVISQYTEIVGRPLLPPYWSLGFHLSRYGYKTLSDTVEVWNRTREAGIPFDTQWNDIDYMENHNDFTYDKERFQGLPEFVDLLHKEGMHYMVVIDPGVSAGELPGSYPPYDDGIAQRVFISDLSGYRPFVGKVWNKESTVFVDFFKPAAVFYWLEQLRKLHNLFPFDGVWVDMNDPSNFLNGTMIGCPNTTLDNPPFLPRVDGQKLYYKTICMSAKHRDGVSHYNLHNVYGLAESIVTNFAMQQIRNKRGFVISSSSFPGHGGYAGVRTGDISSTWDDMAHSISDVLSFSLFGITMSGADICGFNGNATVELCQRWSQLGAFYPFSRNHNSDQSIDQDPVAMGPLVVESARKALLIRYSLLPYLYTLFWNAHTHGETVARPMFVEFPHDTNTFKMNTQFMWGPALLIAPVLKEGVAKIAVYLPIGVWYDFYTGQIIKSNGSTHLIPAPFDTIPLMMRGGYIVPTQHPELTTTKSRSNPIDLLVYLDNIGEAVGELYWDDGDSLDYDDGIFNVLKFTVSGQKLQLKVINWKYTKEMLVLGDVNVFGIQSAFTNVTVDDKLVPFEYDCRIQILIVKHLYLNLNETFEMSWE